MYQTINCGPFKIVTFPIIIVLAIGVCMIVFIESNRYDILCFRKISMSANTAMLGAAVGGKIMFALTRLGDANYSISYLFSGFVFYGGLIGGVIGIYFFCLYKKERFLELTDVYAGIIPLGQAIGRIGCYCNGCCYGKDYSGQFAVPYIVNGVYKTVFPTWFIESLFCFLIFCLLLTIKAKPYCGCYTAWYLMLYSAFRFIIEFYRGDEIRGVWKLFSTSQIISILVFLSGVGILFYAYKKKDKNMIILERN